MKWVGPWRRLLGIIKYLLFLAIAFLAIAAVTIAGCERPRPAFVTHPQGTLRVPYEPASSQTACLVACVTMASNYLLDEPRFEEAAVRQALEDAGLDETQVADLKRWLELQGLYLVTLTGQMDEKPPTGIRFWLQRRGYPVICVINEHEGDHRYNHAVIVTGISENPVDPAADTIYYLDPSPGDPLQSVRLDAFEAMWERGGRTMMLVVAPPSDSPPGPATRPMIDSGP